MKYSMVMLLSVMLLVSASPAALYSTVDLLNGAGGFEFDGGPGPWTLFVDGGETIEMSSILVHSGVYALKTGPATGSSKNWRAYINGISTIANRSHKVVTYTGYKGSSPSWARVILGGSGWMSMATSSTTYLKETLNYYTTGAAENSVNFTLGVYSNSANDTVYIDDVAVFCEIALPNVDASTGDGALWTLTNAGGRIGDNSQLVAFDPDVVVSYVSGFDVGSIQATRNSDNELVLQFENALAGAVTLQVTNPYGEASYMVTIPEPATLALLGLGALAMFRTRKQ